MKNLKQVKIKEKAQRCARSKITSEKNAMKMGIVCFLGLLIAVNSLVIN